MVILMLLLIPANYDYDVGNYEFNYKMHKSYFTDCYFARLAKIEINWQEDHLAM
jgi:hypothetical protein